MRLNTFEVVAVDGEPGSARLSIFGLIGFDWEVTAEEIGLRLQDIERSMQGPLRELVVEVNSRGGSQFEALQIYSMLTKHPARIVTEVTAIAYSAAPLVVQAGDERRAAANAILMIHSAALNLSGIYTPDQIRSKLDSVEAADESMIETFAARSGRPREDIEAELRAETYYTAEQALAAGLIDTVIPAKSAPAGTEDPAALVGALPTDALREIAATWIPEPEEAPNVPDKTPAASPAPQPGPSPQEVLASLRDACPGAPSDFLLAQVDAGADPLAASVAWNKRQSELLDEQRAGEQKRIDDAVAAAAADHPGTGVEPLPTGGSVQPTGDAASDPIAAFGDAVASHAREHGVERSAAIVAVSRAKPELHEAFMRATNRRSKVQSRLLDEKIDLNTANAD